MGDGGKITCLGISYFQAKPRGERDPKKGIFVHENIQVRSFDREEVEAPRNSALVG